MPIRAHHVRPVAIRARIPVARNAVIVVSDIAATSRPVVRPVAAVGSVRTPFLTHCRLAAPYVLIIR